MVASARRAVSNVIAEALLIIVGVSLATALASVALSRVSIIQSRLASLTADLIQALSERLVYVHALYDESRGCFVVYVKNVGRYPVYPIDGFTVLFGGPSGVSYYGFSASPSRGCGCWGYAELGLSNGVIEPGELVALYIYNATAVSPPHYLRLVTAKGTPLEAEFAP